MIHQSKFSRFLALMGEANHQELLTLITPDASFEFPYQLPGIPKVIRGSKDISHFLEKRRFKYHNISPLFITAIDPHKIFAEIAVQEFHLSTQKTLPQHLFCEVEFKENMIYYYKEFFNPVIRLEGLLNPKNS